MMESRITISDSNEISNNGSGICCLASTSQANNITPQASPPSENEALIRLSDDHAAIFESPESDEFFADARIVVGDGREIPVHRCILAGRSSFLKGVLVCGKELRNGVVRLEMKELAKDYEVGFDAVLGGL